jgi:hypothetical protein
MAHKADSNTGTSSGQTFLDLTVPNSSFPDPGPRNLSDSTWARRYQQFLEATTPQQRFS